MRYTVQLYRSYSLPGTDFFFALDLRNPHGTLSQHGPFSGNSRRDRFHTIRPYAAVNLVCADALLSGDRELVRYGRGGAMYFYGIQGVNDTQEGRLLLAELGWLRFLRSLEKCVSYAIYPRHNFPGNFLRKKKSRRLFLADCPVLLYSVMILCCIFLWPKSSCHLLCSPTIFCNAAVFFCFWQVDGYVST